VRCSVVIPSYNRAATLPRAIQSVLDQTYAEVEAVVVDDGSTDGTVVALQAFDDPRLVFFSQPNRGVCAARNAGAAKATGDIFMFLDSDDELLPDAVARVVAAGATGADLVLGGWVHVSPDRRAWGTVVPDPALVRRTRYGPFLAGAFAIRAATFHAAGGYDENLRYSENTELGWRIRQQVTNSGGIAVIEAPLVVQYRQPERAYDRARYDAAQRILDGHLYELEADPGDTAALREFRANYLAIAAVSAARLGRRPESLGLASRAVLHDPGSRARYKTLASVVRTAITPSDGSVGASRTTADVPAAPNSHFEPVRSPGDVHAVVVTFSRPDELRRTLAKLSTFALASITVVDNAPSEASRDAATNRETTSAAQLTHLPQAQNTGPAGGLAAGFAHVLERCRDEDWLLVVNDDGVPGTPESLRALQQFGTWLEARGAPVGAVGLSGARFDRRRGVLERPHDCELAGPLTVDYVAGNQLLMVKAAAARRSGAFDAGLFFGFEELDYCLRLQAAGFGIYVDGPLLRQTRQKHERYGDSVGPVDRPVSAWRRYYSVRNHIVVTRRYCTSRVAGFVTLAEIATRPLRDARSHRADRGALFTAGVRGAVDAWRDRLGERVQPSAD
jgi:GT2 family glycosyltransferase